ncbi:MAG TPA: hypothetical protein VFS59_10055, partial [Gemmatimonadaceae bacterium]|nr:hypothetical protein [Gemmatimonadaceae bacterium]
MSSSKLKAQRSTLKAAPPAKPQPYRPRLVPAPLTRTDMQLSVITLNVLYAVIGVVLMYVSYRAID